jgi:tRNA-splicing ligase RtcB (3'-phosphate/5'-hydroxy nucleic acid ligase)
MSIATIEGQSKIPIKLWTTLEELEPAAAAQLRRTASLPWAFSHIAVMPDVHFGMGATVGSVVALKDAVSPSCVGVDIGCGMRAIPLPWKASQLPDDIKALRFKIEDAVPVGFKWHDHPVKHPDVPAIMNDASELARRNFSHGKAEKQLGSLGGGNHFIELCLDEDQNVWLMLHSGSRGIGNQLAQHHIAIAKKLAHNQELPDPDLSVFLSGTQEMADYRRDLMWAQRYAFVNRTVMERLALDALGLTGWPPESIDCHHNYVAEEVHFGESVLLTRKGAINAEKGRMGIIPGSMGTKSYIVRGLGNPESFNSASHGAGRRMGRNQAKKKFTLEDFAAQTAGVECRKDLGVLDEIPGAYKSIEAVMANQKDLVEVVHTLRQVLCVKG